EAERAGQRASHLGDLERVGEPGAEVIALMEDEHLGLVAQPAERRGVDDAVAVAPEVAARQARRLAIAPAPAVARIGCIGRAGGRRHRDSVRLTLAAGALNYQVSADATEASAGMPEAPSEP